MQRTPTRCSTRLRKARINVVHVDNPVICDFLFFPFHPSILLALYDHQAISISIACIFLDVCARHSSSTAPGYVGTPTWTFSSRPLFLCSLFPRKTNVVMDHISPSAHIPRPIHSWQAIEGWLLRLHNVQLMNRTCAVKSPWTVHDTYSCPVSPTAANQTPG
jgi:hypothetical protein